MSIVSIVEPFLGLIDTYLIAPLVRRLKYFRSFKDNVGELQGAVKDLQARRNDEQSSLKTEENVGLVKTDSASNWFEAVAKIEEEAANIDKKSLEEEGGRGCISMNCWSRYKLSKRSVDLALKAKERQGEEIVLTRQPSLKTVVEMPIEVITTENQQFVLKQILDCIADPETGIIGVCGMGGVGKSYLAKQVNNHFQKNPCFDTVIMFTVSATPNMTNMRTSISKRLGLDLSNDSEDDARKKLFDALGRRKFLLILDDVWSKLKILDVGIPYPRKHKGSKILVISRSKDACTDTGATKTILMQPLSEDESWNLFVEVAGKHVADVADIERTARKIVERCGGLPLAIVTVAHAMANRRAVGSWETALTEMKRSSSEIRGMKEDVFAVLRFSFDGLENDMLKSLFLYCACFPEDYDIGGDEVDDMLNYCVGEGLVDKLGSLEVARAKVDDLLESLKIVCMLEEGENEGTVKMHDMMRDLALWITSSTYLGTNGPKFLVKPFVEEVPPANEWVDVTRVSLVSSRTVELTELKESRNLTTLLLRKSHIRIIPPTNFFQHMNHLRILDLSHTKLECLPKSVSCLENLRVLRLRGCINLRALPPLGMLWRLQVLDLCNCHSLYQQILGLEDEGWESNLRYLNVEWSKASIPEGLLSRLHKLEEARLHGARNIKWRSVKARDHGKGDVSESRAKGQREEVVEMRSRSIDVEELLCLKYLRYVTIGLEGIIISDDWFKPLVDKIRKLSLTRCMVVEQALQAIDQSRKLEELTLDGCPGVKCVHIGAKITKLKGCGDLEIVTERVEVSSTEDAVCVLLLESLPKLEKILVSRTPSSYFGRLSEIEILRCHSLNMVFTKEMPRQFNNLKKIIVESCNKMEVIIEAAEEEEEKEIQVGAFAHGDISPFPDLEELILRELPALHNLYSGNHILHCPLLRFIIVDCPGLKTDPLNIRVTDGLVEVKRNHWQRHKHH